MNMTVSPLQLKANVAAEIDISILNEHKNSFLKEFFAGLWTKISVPRQWDVHNTARYVLAEDGSIIVGNVMRRREGTTILYRAMTAFEEQEHGWDQANQM